jgi:hypothetical protein
MKVAGVFGVWALFTNDTFSLEGTESARANLDTNFLAIDNKSLFLEVWLPDFVRVAL